jgi:transposase
MKQFEEILGVDVSKLVLDAKLHRAGKFCQVENSKAGFVQLMRWIAESTTVHKTNILWCFEHTGMYSLSLAQYLSEKKISFVIVPGLEIKKSIGIKRGKNDKVDAARIAEYAYLRRETIIPTELPGELIIKLRELLGLRDRMVTQRAGYKASLKELKSIFESKHNPELFAIQQNLIQALNKNIAVIEARIAKLIKTDERASKLFDLMNSVKGIGPIVAANLLVVTNCFLSFKTSRQLACYCGIAPFEKQSGSSIRSSSRVNSLANKKMKALLDMSASCAIQHDPELRQYYMRRVSKGKSKKSTINIVRNKLVHRIFAVIKRGTPYVELAKHAA